MSNIDFSQVILAVDVQAGHAADRAAAIKEICTERILAQFPFSAQQNVALALAVNAARPRDRSNDAGLTTSDQSDARTVQRWIADMRATCRNMSYDATADLQAKGAWSALPERAKRFIARF
jgi:hypothetical protein